MALTDWTTGEPRRSLGERMGATRKEKPTETPALGLSGDVVEGFEEEGWRMVEGAQPGGGGFGRRASGAGFEPRILVRGYSVNGVLADGVPGVGWSRS